jgi:hypothetical protein
MDTLGDVARPYVLHDVRIFGRYRSFEVEVYHVFDGASIFFARMNHN